MGATMTPQEFKERRQELGLSVSQLAHVLGVDPRTVRRWEANNQRPPHPTACRILEWMMRGFKPEEMEE